MDRNFRPFALLCAVVVASAASFWTGRTAGRREAPSGTPDTVTVEKWLPAPIPEPDSTMLKPKVVYLPRAVHDTTFVHDTTAVHDSVLVEVPITEKRYEAENYWATVSVPVASATAPTVTAGDVIASPTNLRDCCSITNAVSLVGSFNLATA